MCRAISGWVVRPIGDAPVKVYISDNTDSYEQCRQEFGIREFGHDGFANAAKYEFHPDYARPSPDLSTWNFRLDEDTRPNWLTPEVEAAAREKFAEYAKKFVFTEGRHACTVRAWFFGSSSGTVSGGSALFFGSSSGTVSGGNAGFFDSSSGTVSGGKAGFYDSSSGTVSGGDARFYDSSRKILSKAEKS